jgi:hypothetical protein
MYDRRDRGGPLHGPIVKSGRCADCLTKKNESAKRHRSDPNAPDLRSARGVRAAEKLQARLEAIEAAKRAARSKAS